MLAHLARLNCAFSQRYPGVGCEWYIRALALHELTIFFDWSPADITGVEALTNLEELHLLHDETGVAIDLTVASFPANLVELEIWSDFSISLMPQFPASLEVLRLGEIYDVPVLPPAAGLSDLTPANVDPLGFPRPTRAPFGANDPPQRPWGV
ncbi:MAG: hypothetical protein IPG74_02875 [Flavobacteriales bacterium]|nr:hypothetical protein [Flavobacteriales bacterium]